MSSMAAMLVDVFIMCSDGLTDPLDDKSLEAVLKDVPPADMADVLTEAALDAGTEDNVTVAVLVASAD